MKAKEKQWVERHLGENQDVFQYQEISTTPLGKVVRVINGTDSYYFKTDTLLACEVLKTEYLTHLLPTFTPTLVASCSERSWLLTKHAGREVLYSATQDDWLNAVTILANIHKHTIKTSDLAIFPELTLEEIFHEFLIHPEYLDYWEISFQESQSLQRIAEELKPTIKQINQLVTHPCLCHGDAHAKNVLVNDEGTTVWFDWREAYMGNPLADLGFFLWWLSVDRKNIGMTLKVTEKFISDLVLAYEKAFFNQHMQAKQISFSVTELMSIGLVSRAMQYHRIYYPIKSFKPYYVTYALKQLIKLY